MTLRHLKILITVVDEGSMTNAAKKLFITQPSISQAIIELEKYYEIKIFERLSKKLYITSNGKKLLSYARHIISMFDEMEETIKKEKEKNLLKIGASVTIGTCILSNISKKFIQKHPKTSIKSKIANTSIIEKLILKNDLDFGLTEGPIHNQDIIYKPFMEDKLIAICGKNNPLKKEKDINIEILSKQPLILREVGSGTRELFEIKMKEKNLPLNIVWECNNSEAIKNAVISDIGISVISEKAVMKELSEKSLFKINIKNINLNRKFNIIYHKNKYISENIQEFWNFCLKNNF
ncbi:DNA-binding transcriptional LysR family regulator [Oceanotoga teriensis]|uniref:DNA-binding transcriptional LysR family regulator n=1 Tax=Oceanotoga teriensis TaxID=515440 RepID=A0AA45C7P6_9BACT|nr:LysR family transcriptional regulator [Oceanotoga teriensis]PWJ95524.1 DNA-binding transcriptional LysR family regulator [Oceanotoga teriensis]